MAERYADARRRLDEFDQVSTALRAGLVSAGAAGANFDTLSGGWLQRWAADSFLLLRRIETGADLEALLDAVGRFEQVTRGVDSLPRIEFAVCEWGRGEPLAEHFEIVSGTRLPPDSRPAEECEVLAWADRVLDQRPMTADELGDFWRLTVCVLDPDSGRPFRGRTFREDYRRRVCTAATEFIRLNARPTGVPIPPGVMDSTDFENFLAAATNWVIEAYPARPRASAEVVGEIRSGNEQPPTQDREALQNAAIAVLISIGPNLLKIARRVGIPRSTLRGYPRFMEALNAARGVGEQGRDRLRGDRDRGDDFSRDEDDAGEE